jgi:formylglycine-generating enzyme required for sulfatase activity
LTLKPGQTSVPKPNNQAPKPNKPKKNSQNKPVQTNTLPPKPNTTPEIPAPKPVPTPPVETPQAGKQKKSGFTMVSVAGGNFKTEAKGCSGSVLQMQDFKIGMYEVTQADWREIMGTSPSFHSNCSECPVERVSWDEIQRFLAIASQKRGKKYRLPYEMEWEYAASGGQKTLGKKYAGGSKADGVAVYLNVQESSREVGTKRANELGIFDMSGNVWEWCDSLYPAYLRCAASPSDKKTMRGGSWSSRRDNVTIKASQQKKSRYSDSNIGFRLIEY